MRIHSAFCNLPLRCVMLINIALGCQFLKGGRVSHREAKASSGCDISLEAEMWNLREENGGGKEGTLLPGFLLPSVFRVAYWYHGCALRGTALTLTLHVSTF